ncbi:MAG: hypothetical protein AB8D52_07510 [Gammaproteobacteria bacterium]
MKLNIKLLLITCSLLISSLAAAKSAYIVDQLLVGLHQEKDTGSPIIKVLSTATEVDLILREGDYAQIREKDEGKVGWVDASYLMYDRPAKLLLAELQEKVKTLESQDNAQALIAADTEHEQKTKELTEKIDDLTQNLSSEKLKAGELEATISQHEKKIAQMEAKTSDNQQQNNDSKVIDLKKQVSELQTQLEKIRSEPNVHIKNNQPSTGFPSLMEIFDLIKNRFVQLSFVVLALIAFFVGRRWEDRKIRKRHGGFRI